MSTTLLRLGLWIILIVVALYVVHETLEDSPLVEFFNQALINRAFVVGGVLVAAGFVARLFEKTAAPVLRRNHCAVCRTPVPKGAIYCRPHLRSILAHEDARTHATKIRS